MLLCWYVVSWLLVTFLINYANLELGRLVGYQGRVENQLASWQRASCQTVKAQTSWSNQLQRSARLLSPTLRLTKLQGTLYKGMETLASVRADDLIIRWADEPVSRSTDSQFTECLLLIYYVLSVLTVPLLTRVSALQHEILSSHHTNPRVLELLCISEKWASCFRSIFVPLCRNFHPFNRFFGSGESGLNSISLSLEGLTFSRDVEIFIWWRCEKYFAAALKFSIAYYIWGMFEESINMMWRWWNDETGESSLGLGIRLGET